MLINRRDFKKFKHFYIMGSSDSAESLGEGSLGQKRLTNPVLQNFKKTPMICPGEKTDQLIT